MPSSHEPAYRHSVDGRLGDGRCCHPLPAEGKGIMFVWRQWQENEEWQMCFMFGGVSVERALTIKPFPVHTIHRNYPPRNQEAGCRLGQGESDRVARQG